MIIDHMTIEEKVAQLFIITPESLTKSDVTLFEFDDDFRRALESVHIGGMIYFGRNISDKKQISELLYETQLCYCKALSIPLFQCVDEEGGRVSKVLNSGIVPIDNKSTPLDWGSNNDSDYVNSKGREIGRCLSDLGFNVDFAPSADVLTNANNKVIGNRAFGSDPNVVADMAAAFAQGLLSEKIIPVYKHFPGHGNTDGDSHYGYAHTERTLEDLFNCEFIPFVKGVNAGVPMIMIGHISLPRIIDDSEPSSLSKTVVTGFLREKLGFDGVIITDSLKMKAISDNYSSSEAAIKAIVAGNDMILRPYDFYEAYGGVIDAVKRGRISESRIDDSLSRILKVKKLLLNMDSKLSLLM